MQSSETGMNRSNTQQGFTLAELLVVVFIIGIAVGVMLFRSGDFGYGRSARDISRQLASYCRVIQQQAILQPAVLGLAIGRLGYQVYQYDESLSDWRALSEQDKFWRARKIPVNVEIGLDVDKKRLSLPSSITSNAPQIIFSPSGEVTPFRLQLHQSGKDDSYQIQGNFAGEISTTQLGLN